TKTTAGEYSINLYQDTNTDIPILPLWGDSTIRTRTETGETFTEKQDKIWHPVNREMICQSFQMEFYLSEAQMRTILIQESVFKVHAIELNAEPTGRI
ncbi:unnamed protein product, partial [marine sediment metagenome]